MAEDTPSNELFMYIATTGWKSGRTHEIEIWFVEHDGCYYAVSEYPDKAHWVQNIRRQPQIKWLVGTRADREAAGEHLAQGTGRALDAADDAELIAAVSRLMDAKYNWSTGLIVQICPDAV